MGVFENVLKKKKGQGSSVIPEEPSDDEIVFSSNLEAQSVTCGEQKVRSVWTGIANTVFLLPAPGCSRPRANSRQRAWLSQHAACSPPRAPPPPHRGTRNRGSLGFELRGERNQQETVGASWISFFVWRRLRGSMGLIFHMEF